MQRWNSSDIVMVWCMFGWCSRFCKKKTRCKDVMWCSGCSIKGRQFRVETRKKKKYTNKTIRRRRRTKRQRRSKLCKFSIYMCVCIFGSFPLLFYLFRAFWCILDLCRAFVPNSQFFPLQCQCGWWWWWCCCCRWWLE